MDGVVPGCFYTQQYLFEILTQSSKEINRNFKDDQLFLQK